MGALLPPRCRCAGLRPALSSAITPVCRLEALLRAMEAKMALLARQLSDCEAHRRKFEVQGVWKEVCGMEDGVEPAAVSRQQYSPLFPKP